MKVCGFWIEFGEIEIKLNMVEYVIEVVVIICKNKVGENEICVYFMVDCKVFVSGLWKMLF